VNDAESTISFGSNCAPVSSRSAVWRIDGGDGDDDEQATPAIAATSATHAGQANRVRTLRA
jgi:hypothetical protein